MNLAQLLANLVQRGVEIRVDDEQLTVRAPKDTLTPSERATLGQHKPEILEMLRGYAPGALALFPLSQGQRALWFLYKLAPDSPAYNIMAAVRIRAQLDIPALQAAFQTLVERHPTLHTSYPALNDEPAQLVQSGLKIPIDLTDARNWNETQLQARLSEAADRPFDLQQGPLLRARLFSRSDTEHVLLLTVHHIAVDFWSLEILLEELARLYPALKNHTPVALPTPAHRYTDYVRWQAEMLAGARGQQLQQYWRQQLADAPVVLDLPADRPRPPVQTYRGASDVATTLAEPLTAQLRALARAEGTTLYTTLLAAYQVLLYRYTGQVDFLVGSPMAGRSRAEFEAVAGYFVNPIVIRGKLSGDLTFQVHLQQAGQTVLTALEHADYPFSLLVEQLQPARDTSRSPLFQVAFVWDKLRSPTAGTTPVEPDRLELEPFAMEQRGAQFDLVLTVFEEAETLSISWRYNTDLFDADTVRRIAAHYQTLLAGIAANPAQPLAELPLLTEAERRHLLVEWNDTRTEYPRDRCVQQSFEALVSESPKAVAVVWGETQITYQELNRRANQLAHHLRKLGVGPGVCVGLCMERSIELVVGTLAILKAGGTYTPLDPTYPKERLAFMLTDTRTPVIVAQSRLLERLPAHEAAVLCIDADWEQISGEPDENPPNDDLTAEQAAYVMYTSGSTGRPKGILVPHRAINRLVFNTNYITLGRDDGVAFASNSAFDAATFELWGALLNGARLVVVDKETMLSPRTLAAQIRVQGITTLFLTTALFNQIAREAPQAFQPLHHLLFGGEAVDPQWVRAVLQHHPPQRLLHVYGPTESTTFATWHLVEAVAPDATTVPIGRPVANTQTYILDQNRQPVPVGVPGELYIGGDGLALGYLNRPKLTAEKFITDVRLQITDYRLDTEKEVLNSKFTPALRTGASEIQNSKLYRTGDLVRQLPDGNIEFLGRVDHQIKLRGFRIELGEIETVLKQHPAVQETIVLMREDKPGDKRLAAYLVADPAQPVPIAELRRYLKKKLPEYMVPPAIVQLAALPVNPNGKIDRQALPPPDETAKLPDAAYVAPKTKIQATLAAIWQEVLAVDKVGLYDNFFDLGGHSLLIIQVHSKLRQQLQADVSITDLFHYPTIAALAEYLSPAQNGRTAHHPQPRAMRPVEPSSSAVAIVGMAGRFPKAKNLAEFWQNLRDGLECVSFFSDEELQAAGIEAGLLNNPAYVKANSILEEADMFDAAFFGFNPREAALLDPQHRLFLECAWEALEHAGCDPYRYPGAIGVYAGAGLNTYLLSSLAAHHNLTDLAAGYQILLANDKDFLTTRVSYKLNLKGPSVTVQTACSTSLVAVQMAWQSLLNHQCDMALAGGVSVSFPQKSGYLYQDGMILSPDGHCRTFDAGAQGTISGQGVGLVVLKRLDDALADGDTIHAVIKGAAINNDGTLKVGYTAPSVEGQAEVIAQAQAAAGIEPETISYIEAHGTATPLGDPAEIAALTQAFRLGTNKTGFCAIGSVKSNLGHLDAAAGVTGLLKTVLALEHRQLPPSLHFERPNPEIDFAGSPFFVNTTLTDWPAGDTPRRAGVSSFGIGGTNAHVVLEEAPLLPASSAGRAWQLLLLSAKTETALDASARRLADYLRTQPDVNLADVAHTLQVGRAEFAHRQMVVCRDAADAVDALTQPDSRRVARATPAVSERPVVFMFPGQGAQYLNMALGLYQSEPIFRQIMDQCDELLRPHLGGSLLEAIYPDGRGQGTGARSQKPESKGAGGQGSREQESISHSSLKETWLTQPALFAVEYALARLWQSWGVQPQAMIGHSIGEFVAACLAGVFPLEEALGLVAARGRLMQDLPPGAMLAVSLPAAQVQPLLSGQVALAVINSPDRCVVAGPEVEVEALQQQLTAQGIGCRRLQTSHAFHSAMMEPILADFRQQVQQVRLNPPQIPFISNVSGGWISAEQATDPDYWVQHLRQTVRFADGIAALVQQPAWVLLEVGPGHTLTTLARPQLAPEQVALPSLRHPREATEDVPFLLNSLGRLWLAGVAVDWPALYAGQQRRRLPLPTYPFERQRYWTEPSRPTGGPPAHVKKADLADWCYLPSWQRQTLLAALQPEQWGDESHRWLVFVDDSDLGRRLAERLRQVGQEVTTAQMGSQFEQPGPADFVLNPGRKADYLALLAAMDAAPDCIVHLWTVTPPGAAATPETIEAALQTGFYSLLYLAQALGEQVVATPLKIFAISNNMQEVTGAETLQPEKAALLGPCRVIPQEYPHVRCRSIDIDWPGETGTEDTVNHLLAELLTDSSDTVVAYRRRYRWTQRFEPLRLPPLAGPPPRLKAGGVYLITGGLGGIGLTLAGYLAQAGPVKLALVGRSALPPREAWADWPAGDDIGRKIEQVRALEALGAEVLLFSADVADPVQIRAVVAQIIERFGTLNGVIHAAGVAGGGMIQLKTPDVAAAVLAPKVQGTLALAAALQGLRFDFFVLCSSLNSVMSILGQVDYTAANAFLDAFAHAFSAKNGAPCVAINWDTWQEVGMAVNTAMPRHLQQVRQQDYVKYSLRPKEGQEIFGRILAARLPQVLVSTRDLPTRLSLGGPGGGDDAAATAPPGEETTTPAGAITLHARPEAAGAYVAPRNDIEATLAGIWQELLGVEQVGIEDSFFDLGGDSLLAIQVASRLRDAFQIELPPHIIFNERTIEELAVTIIEQQAGQIDDETLAELLAQIEAIPE